MRHNLSLKISLHDNLKLIDQFFIPLENVSLGYGNQNIYDILKTAISEKNSKCFFFFPVFIESQANEYQIISIRLLTALSSLTEIQQIILPSLILPSLNILTSP